MKSAIQFKMEEPDIEIEERTIKVDNFYTRKVKKVGGSVKYSIPMEIAREMNLTKNSIVYYAIQPGGVFLYFDFYPLEINPKYIKSRKISREGPSGTFYAIIPPMVKTMLSKEIVAVALIHNEGEPSYLWRFQPLPIDSISQNI